MNSQSEIEPDQPSFLSNALSYVKFLGSCISLWSIGYMKFSATWVVVGSLGYFCIQLARNKRVQLSGSLKAIGENEKRFILKNFSARDLPSWVHFPDVERAEWLNKVVKRLWPYLSDYSRNVILNSVAPAVSAQLPSALKPFEFMTIDLGDTPPRIGGIKVYMDENIRRDEIVMDLDIMLYSDARIKVQLGKIKAGVKEFELRGTLRVTLKPLLSKVPFTGAVTVCFLDSPYINFGLTDMGNLLGLPGLQQTLNTVIKNVVNQMIVLPNRLPIQLVDDIDVRRLQYPLPQGVLRFTVISARQLKAGDKNVLGKHSSDPYSVIRVGARSFQTTVIQHTLEPEWNEHFETIVDVKRGQFLEIDVFDKDQGNKDDALGTASIPLESVHDLGNLDTWVKLEGVKTGSVHLKLDWLILSDEAADVSEASEQALHYRNLSGYPASSGFLYVVVEQAKNLKRLKQMREPSPFCNLLLGRDAQKTDVKEYTQSPAWESVHHFLVGDPNVDVLQIIVRDGRSEVLLGKLSVPIRILLTEERMTVSRPFSLEDAGPDGATIVLHLEFKALVARKPCKAQNVVLTTDVTDFTPDVPFGNETEVLNSHVESDPGMNVRQRTNTHQLSPADEHLDVSSGGLSPGVIVDRDVAAQSFSPIPDPPDEFEQSTAPLGRLRLTLEYSSSSSIISVIVHEASGLKGVDKDGLADPYVKVNLLDRHGAVKIEKKTAPLKDTLNPVYEENFEFAVDVGSLPSFSLRFDVKNHVNLFSRSGRTHHMGSVSIDLCEFVSLASLSEWFPLAPLDTVSTCDFSSLR